MIQGREGKDKEWKSLQEQIGFSDIDNDEFKNNDGELQKTIIQRLKRIIEIYKLKIDYITGIQFIINKVEYTEIVVELNKFSKKFLDDNIDTLNVSKVY